MRSQTTTRTGREYLRVSIDKSGRERSPDEQHADNARAADRHGWTLDSPYRDTGSASRHARKRREDFDRLIADLTANRFGADVLLLWESSRGSRKVSEWVALVELCEERGVLIHVTSDGKTYDPADPRDRRSLLEDSVDAEYESAKISKRVKRAAAANAAEGKPHGPAPYGYRRVYDPTTGRPIGQEVEHLEASVVREIYQRIHAGHSLRSIAADLERRGISKRSGQPWPSRHLAIMALRRLYIGERVHDPGHNGPVPSARATITKAIWPAIVDRSLWTAVQRKLTAPERNVRRPGRGVHLLSMLAKCDVCGGPLTVRRRLDLTRDEWMYVCHAKACIGVPYDALNDYAEQKIVSYLKEPRNLECLIVDPVDPVAAEAVEAEVQQIQRELDDLADQLSKGAITATLAARAEPGIQARLKAADQRRDELTRPGALSGLFGGAKKSVTKWWRDIPMSTKREVVRYLCSPEYVGELRVTRAPKRGPRGPVEDRVLWRTDLSLSSRQIAPTAK